MELKSTLWQEYAIDPIYLIGKTARITVVTNEGATRDGRHGNGHFCFGVIESIHEHRGKVILDEPGDYWAQEAIDVDFADTYPLVEIWLRGGQMIRFDPECDAVSIQWREG